MLAFHLADVALLGGRLVQVLVDLVHERLGRPPGIRQHVSVGVVLVQEQRRPVPAVQLLLLLVGFSEDRPVREQHYSARDPERYRAANDCVDFIDFEVALVFVHLAVRAVIFGGVPPQKDGKKTYDHRAQPNAHQHNGHHLLGHVDRVLQRLHYGVVPVHAYAAQVEDRSGGEVHVQGIPHVAHYVPEHPPVEDLHAGVEGHHEHGHEHVGQGEAHHEVVGDHAQSSVPYH